MSSSAEFPRMYWTFFKPKPESSRFILGFLQKYFPGIKEMFLFHFFLGIPLGGVPSGILGLPKKILQEFLLRFSQMFLPEFHKECSSELPTRKSPSFFFQIPPGLSRVPSEIIQRVSFWRFPEQVLLGVPSEECNIESKYFWDSYMLTDGSKLSILAGSGI